ncbi:hypothetical protein H074_08550 [Amycolatopsis decaplanina DSM 44594]|uniref:Uncharacterized protein n=1 Tax=Amycolatopsis decaplanina DSM 44594 TaxID=1284240 RepID=M2XN90_9PSEU|nr:hypothetical protein H074_08550 [Amycolatopsis decaplanina DSM 44594]
MPSPAVRAGIGNAATSLLTTGLVLAAAGLIRRRRRDHAEALLRADEASAYEHFVRDFGPCSELSDTQVAALTTYLSGRIDQYVPTTVAELLRGLAWNWHDENDEPDEDQPRVRHITALVDGLAR